MNSNSIRFIDLFCGTGGIRLGLEGACASLGLPKPECVFSADSNPDVCKTYEENFGVNPFGDVRKSGNLPDFDVLLAGFPCQAFSYAGKQLGFDDTRGTLFFEVARIINESRPALVFLENVAGLVSHDKGRTFKVILNTLRELGYHVAWQLLDAAEHGVPQARKRIYIVAARDKEINPFANLAQSAPKLIGDILESNPDPSLFCSPFFTDAVRRHFGGDLSRVEGCRFTDKRGGERNIHSWDLALRGECTPEERAFMVELLKNRRRAVFREGRPGDDQKLTRGQIATFHPAADLDSLLSSLLQKGYLNRDEHGRYNPNAGNMSFELFKVVPRDGVSLTLTSSDCSHIGVYDGENLRRISPREAARIMGYPDSFKLPASATKVYRQMGNAVCVPVVEKILAAAIAELN